jgi:uncharacterized protein
MMTMRESAYNIRVPLLNGRALLFNSLSRGLCMLEAEEVEILDRVAEAAGDAHRILVQQLTGQGFVVREGTDEVATVRKQYEARRYDPGAVTVTVCPTLACNFGCDYCFQGADKPAQKMAASVQDQVVELYRRILDRLPGLHTLRAMWYGGEPLANPAAIESLSRRFIEINRERGINYSASMISNGSLMDRAMAERLYALGLRSVQITLDGARADHDARRHYLSGRGSYDRIIQNIRSWVYDFPIHIDMRVNIDERNRDGVVSLIDDLADQGLANLPNLRMYFAPVESITKGCHAIADKMMQKVQYGQLESMLVRYAYERGLAELPYPPSFMGICSALRPFDFIVVPTGDVHKCWDTVSFPEKKVGSVFDMDALFSNPSLAQREWAEFNPFDNATCRSCKILPNCASFCAHKFVNAEETVGEASLPCPSLKYSINEKIVLRAEKEGYITRADYDPAMIKTDPGTLCSEVFIKEHYLKRPERLIRIGESAFTSMRRQTRDVAASRDLA